MTEIYFVYKGATIRLFTPFPVDEIYISLNSDISLSNVITDSLNERAALQHNNLL